MVNKRQKKILILAVRAGEILLKSGAEIYRVEDTIKRICKACRIPYVDAFVTPTVIMVSLDPGSEDNNVYSYVRTIHSTYSDLTKVSEINKFSRKFTTTDLSVEEGMDVLDEIENIKPFPLPWRAFSAAIGTGFVSIALGGGPFDLLCAFVIGPLCYLLGEICTKSKVNFFIRGFLCCFVATLLALLATLIVPTANFSSVIIGVIMLFVPGIAITNCVRDLLAGDMMAGGTRLIEAIMIAVSLAAGTGLMLKIWIVMGGAA